MRDIFSCFLDDQSNIFKEPITWRNPMSFIQSYLLAGGKTYLISDICDALKHFDTVRARHIISAYLVGILIVDNIPKIKEKLDCVTRKNEKGDNLWLYTWFLTCLYHDMGYIYESNSNLYKAYNLDDFLPAGYTIDVCSKLNYYDLGKKYYLYRKSKDIIDHGVVGGFRLYAIISKIYNDNDGKLWDMGNYALIFPPEIRPLHKLAADAIIRHNMWMSNNNTKKNYMLLGLNELISDDEDKRIKSDEIFTFLLSLCDTIEPIKRFGDLTAAEVLHNINFEFKDNTTCISIPNLDGRDDYISTIKSLSKWVNLEIKYNNKNESIRKIEISI